MRYNIFNPTQAGRVIYNGISAPEGSGQQRKITVLPGETKRDVELADHIAAGFNCAPTDDVSDLVLTRLDQKPENNSAGEAKAMPVDYVPYRAPPIGLPRLESMPDFDPTALELSAAAEPVKRRRRVAGSIIED